jgi:hypothetical protein
VGAQGTVYPENPHQGGWDRQRVARKQLVLAVDLFVMIDIPMSPPGRNEIMRYELDVLHERLQEHDRRPWYQQGV